jgi:hypothetical protein
VDGEVEIEAHLDRMACCPLGPSQRVSAVSEADRLLLAKPIVDRAAFV